VFTGIVVGWVFTSFAEQPETSRDSRLFRVNARRTKILGPATHLPKALGLRLVSVTTDQPQYWPNEKVRVKILMPGLPKHPVEITWQKRDATPHTLPPVLLDAYGVAVVEILDGTTRRLELGEYRVDVGSKDKSLKSSATFSVVEGALGALSLAYEFKRCTSFEELGQVKAGWFLGNIAGSGKRWGNSLALKNELRVENRPYTGKATLISRCFLPGCNGVQAGPPQEIHVKDGRVMAIMDIRGHSGPFQVEFVTPQGSLRHQFEGSGHIERQMFQISMGVGWIHKAGLAPYEGSVQVPGRQIFLEKQRDKEEAPFEVPSVIAVDGEMAIHIRRRVTGAALHVWRPNERGTFEPHPVPMAKVLRPGDTLRVKVAQPYSLVAIGGHDGTKLREGYAIAFPPAGMKVSVEVPAVATPLSSIPVSVALTDALGHGVPASGILEVFDTRVASQSPASPLASAIGDSFRNASNALTHWVDPIESEEQRKREERELARQARASHRREAATKLSGSLGSLGDMRLLGSGGSGYGLGAPVMPKAKLAGTPTAAALRHRVGGTGTPLEEEGDSGKTIREGEKKVVFCERIELDASGRKTVEVRLPPQTGRVAFRFVAVRGLDHAVGHARADTSKRASAELRLPNTFVPGARIEGTVVVANTTGKPALLRL